MPKLETGNGNAKNGSNNQSALAAMLRKQQVEKPKMHQKRTGPLWKGPMSDDREGGITFSLLSRFLSCRERFRLLTVEGLKVMDSFNHRLEYGNMWHLCEEALAAKEDWRERLKAFCQDLCKQYKLQQALVSHWYNVCKAQFPIYVKFWKEHPDVVNRTPLFQEYEFKVPYRLPSGRVVYLRGKWDSVDHLQEKPTPGIFLQENKAKGDINELALRRQLKFDLQTMIYFVTLNVVKKDGGDDLGLDKATLAKFKKSPILGVRYNVIRRPLSSGKHNIKQLQNVNLGKRGPNGEKLPAREETKEEYYKRLEGLIKEDANWFFMRWRVTVSQTDMHIFQDQCLNPILEQLCDWWEWVSFAEQNKTNVWDNDVIFGARPDTDNNDSHASAIHWRHPFGVYNPLDEGGSSDVDEYIFNGSTSGLKRATTLFPEMKNNV